MNAEKLTQKSAEAIRAAVEGPVSAMCPASRA